MSSFKPRHVKKWFVLYYKPILSDVLKRLSCCQILFAKPEQKSGSENWRQQASQTKNDGGQILMTSSMTNYDSQEYPFCLFVKFDI
jgi:hypothetical protein